MATVCVYVAAGAICWYIPTHTVHFQRQMGTSDRAFKSHMHAEAQVPNYGMTGWGITSLTQYNDA